MDIVENDGSEQLSRYPLLDSVREWDRLCGQTIKTADELRIHNNRLPPPAGAIEVGLKLRVLTYNIHNFRGYPEEIAAEQWQVNPREKLDLQLRAFGMLDPHVASLQECFHDKKLQLELVEQLGYRGSFFPASYHWHCAGAILSRYPLLDSVNLTFFELNGKVKMKRYLGRSLIRLPGGQEILIYGGHYDPEPEDELALIEQIYQIDQGLQRPMIWTGDWNIKRSHRLYSRFKKMGLVDASVHLGLPDKTTTLKDKGQGGIDYIFCTRDIIDRLESIEIVGQGAATLDPNNSGSIAASDHLPVLAVFRF
jgi:endonuclease/exonuclease/phosphatase family metal-dependent hydrolase